MVVITYALTFLFVIFTLCLLNFLKKSCCFFLNILSPPLFFYSYSRDVVEFKRVSQKDNPEVLYCPFPSQFQYEINVIKYVVRELASLVDKCGSDDEDCSNFATPTNFYSFPPATNFKSSVDIVAVDDEEGAVGSGSGSGSGGGSMFVCEREVPTNAVITELLATQDKVIKQEASGSATHRWSYSITMVTVLLTFIFTAFL